MKKKDIKNIYRLALDMRDTDGDELADWEDCVPNDASRQHHPGWHGSMVLPSVKKNLKIKKTYSYKGHAIDEYVYDISGRYVLKPKAKKHKRFF
jgi:hypothetical protein